MIYANLTEAQKIKRRAYSRQYRLEHLERFRAQHKQYNIDHRDELNAKRRARRAAGRENIVLQQSRARVKKYGLTPEIHAALFEVQHHVCGVCQAPVNMSSHIDHDHTTKKIRGILCNRCNLGLGYFKDNISTLEAALRYLSDPPMGRVYV